MVYVFVLCANFWGFIKRRHLPTFLSFFGGVSGNRIWQRPGVIILVSQPLGFLELSLPLGYTFQRVCKVTKTWLGRSCFNLHWLWLPWPGSFLGDFCLTKPLWNWTRCLHCNLLWTLTDISHTCTKHTNVFMLHKYLFYNLTTLSQTHPLYSPIYRATESTLNPTQTHQRNDKHMQRFPKIVVGWVSCCCLSLLHPVVHFAPQTRYKDIGV